MQIKRLVSTCSRTGRDLQRYNFEGCRQVVGCIPYRFKKNHKPPSVHGTLINELEFLLISSQKSTRMMFPKGGWELDETIEEAASRETMEEAGVLGAVGKKLGVWTFKSKSQDICHEGHMLAFRVTEELDCWPEKDVRQRIWLSADEAKQVCAHEWMKEALDKFIFQLEEEEEEEDEYEDEDEDAPQPPTLLDLLLRDESICGRVSLSGDEDEMNCTLKHFQRKEEDCRIHLFPMHLPMSPCSAEKTRISRVSQGGEEDVDRVVLLVN